MQETREITVGVTDRVSAQIISGLEEGEKVAAGSTQAAPGARPARGNNNGQGGRGPGGPGGVGGFR